MGEFMYSCAPTRSNWLRAMRCNLVVEHGPRACLVPTVRRETEQEAQAQARRAVEEAFDDGQA